MELKNLSSALENWIDYKKKNLKEMQILKKEVIKDFIDSVWGVIFPGYKDEIEDKNTYFDLIHLRPPPTAKSRRFSSKSSS